MIYTPAQTHVQFYPSYTKEIHSFKVRAFTEGIISKNKQASKKSISLYAFLPYDIFFSMWFIKNFDIVLGKDQLHPLSKLILKPGTDGSA